MKKQALKQVRSPVPASLIFRALAKLSTELGEEINGVNELIDHLPTLAILAGVTEADRSSAS